MTENIFEHILSSGMVDELNLGEEKMILQMFTHLCNSIDVRDSNSIESVLNIILDRVAFFPVRPADMKTELERAGLEESLSRKLSEVWSQHARQVVSRRKRVGSDIKGVNFLVLKDVVSNEERIQLQVNLSTPGSRILNLSFSTETMFQLYQTLETVQQKLDQLCS